VVNGKLILALSFFGLAMGAATVYVIPSTECATGTTHASQTQGRQKEQLHVVFSQS
jgi:hypothetical protein